MPAARGHGRGRIQGFSFLDRAQLALPSLGAIAIWRLPRLVKHVYLKFVAFMAAHGAVFADPVLATSGARPKRACVRGWVICHESRLETLSGLKIDVRFSKHNELRAREDAPGLCDRNVLLIDLDICVSL